MKVGARDYYRHGDHNAICDSCGFKYKASELRRRWDGFYVCDADYEERHPQDLIKPRKEKSSVPWSRPAQNDYILGLSYQLADGTYMADGTIIADGGAGSPTDDAEVFVVFGPVDPDSL